MLQPFIPDSAPLLLDRLGVDPAERTLSHAKKDERAIGMPRFLSSMESGLARPPIFNALGKKASKA